MGQKVKYAEVVLPLAAGDSFTYGIPQALEENLRPGHRVIVQFGSRKVYSAIVWDIHTRSPKEEPKQILGLLDQTRLIDESQQKFWEWLADYYICTLGEVMKAALPAGLKLESQTRIQFLDSFDYSGDISDYERVALEFIRNNPGARIDDLASVLKKRNPLPLIKSLVDKNAVSLEEKILQAYKPKTSTVLSLNPEYDTDEKISALLETLHKAPKQEKCLLAFLGLINEGTGSNNEITPSGLCQACGESSSLVNALVAKNILLKKTLPVSRITPSGKEVKDPARLTPVQETALLEIKKIFENGRVCLLNGVTSSGKTEIYIHLAQTEMEKGRQVLYLLPEIALTSQIINRLTSVFGDKAAIFHSRMTDAERVEIWKNTADPGSRIRIFLGARSAVFLPFKDLGLIIVDEEHDSSYKQQDPSPRYQARDAAIVLGKIHGAGVILGSATPSLESYHNARTGKYGLVEIGERFTRILMPEIRLANTREAYKRKIMRGHFTPELLKAIDDALVNGEQVILFQNRRGYSPYLECGNCGHIPKCRDCDVSLTVHKNQGRLVCHYCGYSEKLYAECRECGSTGLLAKGLGTEKIEDEIRIMFPEARVARLDLDSARSKKGYTRIISEFEDHQTDILIGTQMISKGLDFDHVRLVGIINADNLLHFPDFRSFEKSFQLITQVSGRSGRKNTRGNVIVQTGDPTHRVLQQVLNNDFNGMYQWEMSERQAFSYPPYTRLIKLTFKHKDIELLKRSAGYFAGELRRNWSSRVLGPQAPPIARINKLYLRTIMIKSGKGRELVKIRAEIRDIISRMKADKTFRPVIIQADVDPA